MQNVQKLELICYGVITFLVALGSFLSLLAPHFFKNSFVVEDGPVEWMTVLVLVICAALCFFRVFHLRTKKPKLFLSMTFLLGILFIFFAGEEISWGQRIFDIETPHWFEKKNAQQEINLHNLRVNGVKLNKIIFVYGMGLVLLTFWFVITPAYGKYPRVAQLMDALGAPIPHKHQVIAYVVLIFAIQLLVFSTKRGELLECTGVMLFLLNLLYPYNRDNFR